MACAILLNLVQYRSGQQSALRPRMPCSDCFVVRVEQQHEFRVERLICWIGGENGSLEKPSGMSQVPLDRAGIGHRLELAILGRERFGEPLGRPDGPC